MTARAKEESITNEDVCLQLSGTWYLIPFFILEEMFDDLKYEDGRTAEMLRHWLDTKDNFPKHKDMNVAEVIQAYERTVGKKVHVLESIITRYAPKLESFILYN